MRPDQNLVCFTLKPSLRRDRNLTAPHCAQLATDRTDPLTSEGYVHTGKTYSINRCIRNKNTTFSSIFLAVRCNYFWLAGRRKSQPPVLRITVHLARAVDLTPRPQTPRRLRARENLCTDETSANYLRLLRHRKLFHPMGRPHKKFSRCCRADSTSTRRTTLSFARCRRRKGFSTR
jgi:hypothetical protein